MSSDFKAFHDSKPVAILPMEGIRLFQVLPVLEKLENAGLSWFIIWEPSKLSKRLPKVEKLQLPWALIIGQIELQTGQLKLKHLPSRQEFSWSINDSSSSLEQFLIQTHHPKD